MGQTATKTDILLEAGTNELEILVFSLAGQRYGVNVAKVREVVRWIQPAESPRRHASVLGMINMRGTVLPLVDLAGHLGLTERIADTPEADRRIIITEFNAVQAGFVVHGVEQIHRLSWQRIRPAPDLGSLGKRPDGVSAKAASTCTGVLELGGKGESKDLVLMLDFESVSDEILSEDRLRVAAVENTLNVDRPSKRVLMAEDSPFMRELIRGVFTRSGYTRIRTCSNGLEAWQELERAAGEGEEPYDCVISDIEMPQVDGLHLTKKIKDDARLKHTPVILFSSLITKDNLKKGAAVGADAQVPKPELEEMVRLVDRAVSGQRLRATDAA